MIQCVSGASAAIQEREEFCMTRENTPTVKNTKKRRKLGTGGFIMFENIDFNALIEKATKEKCEITISYEPNRTEITIQPWKPFSYACPYKAKQED